MMGLCLIGCDTGPAMVPVTGTVMLDKTPLPGGRILFEPVGASADSKSAVGDVAEDGTFELFTTEPGDGVIVGSYYPVVMDPKDDDQDDAGGGKKRRSIGIVELKQQTCEVTADGDNAFEIVITKKDLKYAVQDD